MEFQFALECCLFSDSTIVEGEYTVVLTGNDSGPLNSGIHLFSTVDMDKRDFEKIEYRLASILTMLFDSSTLSNLSPSEINVPICVSRDAINNKGDYRGNLIKALEFRGVSNSSAIALVDAQWRPT